jgi:hypothetical protein
MCVKGGAHHYNLRTIDISSCFKYCLVFINKHLILYRHQGCMVLPPIQNKSYDLENP